MKNTDLELDTLLINSQDSLIRFKNISVKSVADTTGKKRSVIHDVEARNITFSKFNFNSLMTKNNFYFGKLVIDSVLVNVDQFEKEKIIKNKRIEPFDINLKDKIPFSILMDTIKLDNFFLKIKL
jgi:hypothetical protein